MPRLPPIISFCLTIRRISDSPKNPQSTTTFKYQSKVHHTHTTVLKHINICLPRTSHLRSAQQSYLTVPQVRFVTCGHTAFVYAAPYRTLGTRYWPTSKTTTCRLFHHTVHRELATDRPQRLQLVACFTIPYIGNSLLTDLKDYNLSPVFKRRLKSCCLTSSTL